jgi:hypothetical protein
MQCNMQPILGRIWTIFAGWWCIRKSADFFLFKAYGLCWCTVCTSKLCTPAAVHSDDFYRYPLMMIAWHVMIIRASARPRWECARKFDFMNTPYSVSWWVDAFFIFSEKTRPTRFGEPYFILKSYKKKSPRIGQNKSVLEYRFRTHTEAHFVISMLISMAKKNDQFSKPAWGRATHMQ